MLRKENYHLNQQDESNVDTSDDNAFPEVIELGDAASLTMGNAEGADIDPGVPPIAHRQVIHSV